MMIHLKREKVGSDAWDLGEWRVVPLGKLFNFKGFTLIELLVVIGIIAILAGLLMPALSRARERGRGIKCINNLKNHGVGMLCYIDDYGYYPPGRQDGVTQWDLCVGIYAGGKADLMSEEARTAIFMCPSVKVPNTGVRLNYSANPNICKEVTATVGPTRPEGVTRPTEVIVAADSIQYSGDGNSHAILWGVEGSSGAAIYWDNGEKSSSEMAIREGVDKDQVYDVNDPQGANFRYRHGNKAVNALFADGHAGNLAKGQIKDKNVYTNY
jgi:prepilin-type N-terminal cleavage/methylation domain-containing protein/prepilin-type processing-associated H-X9-DG protein